MSDCGNRMRNSPLLPGLAEEEVASLLGVAERRRYGAQDLIVREGTASDCLFILARGSVAVEREGGSVQPAILDEGGDSFGEMIPHTARHLSLRLREADARIVALSQP